MASYRITKIELKAFRSFVEETTIEFPKTGLVLINGKNLDTGGSSGAGKSSIALALALGLGYCPFSFSQLRSFDKINKKHLSATFYLEMEDGETYKWKKSSDGVSNSFQKLRSKEAVITGALATADKVKEVTRLDPEILSLLTYRQQREKGFFLSMGDADKKDFLNKVLKLDVFDRQIMKSEERIKILDEDLLRTNVIYTVKKEHFSSLMIYQPKYVECKEEDFLNVTRASFNNVNADYKNILAVYNEQYQKEEENFKERLAQMDRLIPVLQSNVDELEDLKQDKQRLAEKVDKTKIQELWEVLKVREKKLEIFLKQDSFSREEYTSNLRALEKHYQLLSGKLNELSMLEAEKAALSKENKSLATNLCPTCERQWDTAKSRQTINDLKIMSLTDAVQDRALLETELSQTSKKIKELQDFQTNPAIEDIKIGINDINIEIQREKIVLNSKLAEKAAEITEEINLLKLRIKDQETLREKKKNEFLTSPKESDKHKEIALQLESQLGDLKIKLLEFGEKVRTARTHNRGEDFKKEESTAVYEKNKKIVEELEVTIAQKQLELNIEMDFVALVGKEGFLGAIFDEILVEISKEANRILANVPNTAKCSIWFDSEKTNQKGTIKKTIVPIVRVDGIEGPYKSALSGGMISVLELAVDLAVSKVIASRTGVNPGWLILDEAFDGLGPIEKESYLKVLSAYAIDKLVLVIDHTTEFKELFNEEITVCFSDQKSWIDQNTIS